MVTLAVRDGNLEQALRNLKKRIQREGIFREVRDRVGFIKPSEERAKRKKETARKIRKTANQD